MTALSRMRLECVAGCAYCAGFTDDVDPSDGPASLTTRYRGAA